MRTGQAMHLLARDRPSRPARPLRAIVGQPRFIGAIGVAVLAGAVRGFSGFGSALIYMPLVAAVYDPRIAAVTLLLIDTAGAAPFAVRAFRALHVA